MSIPALSVEAYTPPDVLHTLLAAAGTDLVLVGGQALAYWMGRYGIETPGNRPAISRDVDFLVPDAGDKTVVKRMASALKGAAAFPPKQALTALVGQAYRKLSATEFLNIDLLCKLVGPDAAVVRAGALVVIADGVTFRVMHPMDVLSSRLHNLYSLKEKQTELGELQLRAAIDVVRAAQRELAPNHLDDTVGRSPLMGWAKSIEHLARIDAGVKVARRYGIHVADAIEVEVITSIAYRTHKLPRLARIVSPQRWDELAPLVPPSTAAVPGQ